MSTIKSSDEHLTINADGSGKGIKFQANGVEKASIDSSGNVGIGVTPKSWGGDWKGVQINTTGAISTSQDNIGINENATNTSGWKYITSSHASQYYQTDGTHTFKVAPSGSADSAISWTNAMTIDNSGRVTMPSQPVASFGWTNNVSTNNVIPADSIRVNIGSHLNSSGRFTAPIAGTYWYGYVGMAYDASGNFKVELLKNGSLYGNDTRAYTHNIAYSQNSIFGFVTLSANDYLEFKPQNAPLHANYGQISIKLVA